MPDRFFDIEKIKKSLRYFKNAQPFDHCVVDGFLREEFTSALEREFLNYDDPRWFYYKNDIENKKALNDWNVFPSLTYKVFSQLISDSFISILSEQLDIRLYPDPGLHGGGWHIHDSGGNLNPHFDYSIHPKIGLQRKINIIIYLSSELKDEHGGHLGLWEHNPENCSPGSLITMVQPKFNRAVIFDTTQNSWHGMCKPLIQPKGIYRKSLAVYYLTDPAIGADLRERALFAARENQIGDKSIEELIRKRADPNFCTSVYRDEKNGL